MSALPLAVFLLMLASAACAQPAMLSRDWGQPIRLRQVSLIAPEGPARSALEDALRQAGAEVLAVTPGDALLPNGLTLRPELLARTLVLLGGIHTNPALLPLYANYLSFGDAAYPGGDGFVIRPIERPFGPDTAAVALEATSQGGEAAAVARFAELLTTVRDGALPPHFEAHLSPQWEQTVASVGDPGMRYALAARASDGAAGVANLLQVMDPQTGIASAGDYGMERWVREYGYLQDVPGVGEADVQALDDRLLKTLLATQGEYWRARGGGYIGGRHQTMGTSAFACAVHLLRRRGSPNAEARQLLDQWWSECEAYWRNACSTFHDDLEGIPVYYCPEPTLDWALILGVDGYVKDQLPLACLRAYTVVDNLGFYAGTGTYEECRPGDVYKPVPWGWLLRAAAYFHPGQGYDWVQEHMQGTGLGTWALGRSVVGARNFSGAVASTGPPDWLGIRAAPLGEYRYRQLSHDRTAAREKGERYLAAPLERTFEKLCFRDSFEPDGQYLVLEGFQVAAADNQPPLDANSIIRYTDLGHVWLHANTEKQGNLPRTAVYCTDGRNDSPQPAGCELQALHDGQRVGLVASHFPDYTACDWTRNIVWRRGEYFVIVDLLTQTREGRFGLICTFRTPQRAWLEPDGMVARDGLAGMRVRNADAVALALEGGDELEGAAVPTLLRQTQLLDGQPGDLRVFRNALYAADPQHPADLQARPLGATGLLVRGSIRGRDELALIAAAPSGQRLECGPLVSDAQVVYVSATDWAQAGGKGLRLGALNMSGSEGQSPDGTAALLQRLWAQATTPARPSATSSGQPVGRVLWHASAFSRLAEAVAAPAFTSTPAAQGQLATLFDRVVTRWATVSWPGGSGVQLELDLRDSRPLSQVDFHTNTFGDYNRIPDPATYPPPRTVQAEFSDDGFRQDIRRKVLTFTSDCTFENLHKGTVWPILRWTCREVGEKARHLRLIFPPSDWPGGLGMTELSVRADGAEATRVAGLLQRDVDGDGRREAIVWSDQAGLAVVRADGSVMLRKRMPGYITAVECYPELAGPGTPPRLLVTTREARLYCLQPDGTELWRMDFLESAKQNADLPIGYSIGLLHRPDGMPLIVVGNYNLASFVTAEGKLAGDCRLPAAFQTMTLSHGFDYDNDGAEEIISTEVWGCLSVLDTQMRRKAGGSLPRGKGVLLEYWGAPAPGQARVAVCTENGLGRLDPATLKYEWLHALTPINDCVLGDVNADGVAEAVLGKADGYLLVYDAAGELARSLLVGEAVRAVAVVSGSAGPRVVAALPGRLVAYSPALEEPQVVAVGEYARLEAADEPGVLLAAGADATLTAFHLP